MTRRHLSAILALLATATVSAPLPGAHAARASQTPLIFLVIAVDNGHGRAYLGDPYDRRHRPVRVLDMATGAFLSPVPLPVDNQFSALAVDAPAHRVYVAFDGYAPPDYAPTTGVRTLDTGTGAVVRTVSIVSKADAIAVDPRAGLVYVASGGVSPCTISGHCLDTGPNVVYDALISVLDARRGVRVRTLTVRDVLGALLAVDGRARRVVLVGAADVVSRADPGTNVSVLDAFSGRLARRTHLAGGRALRPVVDEATRRAYVATTMGQGGRVDLFATQDGRRVRTVHLDSAPLALAVGAAVPGAPSSDYVAVTTLGPVRTVRQTLSNGTPVTGTIAIGRGSLTILDARSGTLRHRVVVGIDPQALAIDERRGWIVVANVGGSGLRGAPYRRGSVNLIDARAGVMRRNVSLDIIPFNLALDTRTGRAIVSGYNEYTGRNSIQVVDISRGAILRTVSL